MAITRTLLQLRNRVLYLADVQTATTSAARHQTTDLNTEINDSYRAYLELVKTRGFDLNLVETAQAGIPTTRADTGEAYSTVPWPDLSGVPASYIKRVDTLVSGEWLELERRDWVQLRSEYHSSTSQAPRPLVWAPKSEGSVSGDTFTAGTIALAPFSSSSGGKYKITFQPEWVDISSDTNLLIFTDVAGYRWTVYDMVVKIAARDRDNKAQYVIATAERDKAAIAIGEFVPMIAETGPLTMTRSPMYVR